MIPSDFDEYMKISSGERYLWATYLILVFLSSIIGDSIILIASTRYNAIRLNRIIVAVMQHIAICDITASLSYVLPMMISLIANGWILGGPLAYCHVYFEHCSMVGSNLFICALTCSKLLILKFPLRKQRWTTKKAHVACACIWILSLVFPAIRLALDQRELIFDFISYTVNYGIPSQYSKADDIAFITMHVLSNYIPLLTVIITTSLTLLHLNRSRKLAKWNGREKRWQGIVTVVATATVFCISVIPGDMAIYTILHPAEVEEAKLRRFCDTSLTFNIVCNFFIYSLTVPSFRNFIKSKISQLFARLSRCLGVCRKLQVDSAQRAQHNLA